MLRRVLVLIAILSMGVSFSFTWRTSAHNIDLDKAWELARNYARSVREESNGKYLHYTTNCVKAFPGHNHFVRCVIEFQNAKDTAAGVYTCKESIELYMVPHDYGKGGPVYTIYAKHTSGNTCGARRLNDTRLG
jgi:hypothetical protein